MTKESRPLKRAMHSTISKLIRDYLQSNDLFLAGIANVGVVVEAFEDESFDVRLHCVLPYDNPYNNEQSLNYGYLYYTFTKVD